MTMDQSESLPEMDFGRFPPVDGEASRKVHSLLTKESLWSAIGDFQHDGDEVRVSFKQVMDFHM